MLEKALPQKRFMTMAIGVWLTGSVISEVRVESLGKNQGQAITSGHSIVTTSLNEAPIQNFSKWPYPLDSKCLNTMTCGEQFTLKL